MLLLYKYFYTTYCGKTISEKVAQKEMAQELGMSKANICRIRIENPNRYELYCNGIFLKKKLEPAIEKICQEYTLPDSLKYPESNEKQ